MCGGLIEIDGFLEGVQKMYNGSIEFYGRFTGSSYLLLTVYEKINKFSGGFVETFPVFVRG